MLEELNLVKKIHPSDANFLLVEMEKLCKNNPKQRQPRLSLQENRKRNWSCNGNNIMATLPNIVVGGDGKKYQLDYITNYLKNHKKYPLSVTTIDDVDAEIRSLQPVQFDEPPNKRQRIRT